MTGASPGFGRGGAKNIFFRFGNLHVAKRQQNYHFLYKKINILDTRLLWGFGVYFESKCLYS